MQEDLKHHAADWISENSNVAKHSHIEINFHRFYILLTQSKFSANVDGYFLTIRKKNNLFV